MMALPLGIVLALVAMFCWGFGDFFIQKSTRKFGDWETLFIIAIFGVIILFPFVFKDFSEIFNFQSKGFIVLLIASIVLLFAAILDFEALKKGKLSVVEPIYSLEIPIASILAYFLINEAVSTYQIRLIILLVAGLFLVSFKTTHFSKSNWFEKGVILVLLGTIFMGTANFFFGLGARIYNPISINWFVSLFLVLISFFYLLSKNKIKKMFKDIKKNKEFIFKMCVLDNAAWIAFAFALVLTPIAIATALSESYIVIAVLLGTYVNKEPLHKHQKIGLVLAIISAVLLSFSV